ncbi:MAG: hypothetical protein HC804_06245 [Anaerolineae bacterium]|nr:hypothetical protein [Anaerolineae bacterium]
MKERTTLFNARHLALMHGLSINPTPSRRPESEADWREGHHPEQEQRHGRRSHWWLLLLHLFTKTA